MTSALFKNGGYYMLDEMTYVISSSIKFLFLNNEAYTAKKLEISDFNIRYIIRYSFILLPKDLFMKNGQQTIKVIFKVK